MLVSGDITDTFLGSYSSSMFGTDGHIVAALHKSGNAPGDVGPLPRPRSASVPMPPRCTVSWDLHATRTEEKKALR